MKSLIALDECKATVDIDEVAAFLPTCARWAHCHGVQDRDKPMDSGLVMWDRNRLMLNQAVLLLRSNNVPLVSWVPFVHFGV